MADVRPSTIVYRVDGDDIIRHVDDGWLSFAAANGSPGLTRDRVLGRYIFDFISGDEARHIFKLLFGRVRGQRASIRVPFRCDAPALRRFMMMTMSPYEGTGVQFESEVVREEAREFVSILDAIAVRCDEFVRVCSWCKRVCLDEDSWVDVERAVAALDLLSSRELPQLTHGICPECLDLIQRARALRSPADRS